IIARPVVVNETVADAQGAGVEYREARANRVPAKRRPALKSKLRDIASGARQDIENAVGTITIDGQVRLSVTHNRNTSANVRERRLQADHPRNVREYDRTATGGCRVCDGVTKRART